MPTRSPDARGFTLIEVMVALLIMALMAVMAWRGMDALIRTRDISQAKLEQTMRLQTVMGQWEQDLLSVQDAGTVPALRFDGATLRLTRRRPEGMQVVAWSKQGNAWLRWESAVTQSSNELLASYQYSLQLQADAPGMVHAVDGVSAWQLYFYRGNAWSNAMSTGDVAAVPGAAASAAPGAGHAPGASFALPSGVKLALHFEEGSGWSGALNRTVVLGPHP